MNRFFKYPLIPAFLAVLFLCQYLAGFYICVYSASACLGVGGGFYVVSLYWFIYVNWPVAIIQLLFSGYQFHVKRSEYKLHLISAVIALLIEGFLLILGQCGIYLTA